ncbi:MAG: hypothetical protein K2Q18_09200 [Bdellovibrionales bacterium]|nr:hypothetical protein [Bdellovibrionales bacterium]
MKTSLLAISLLLSLSTFAKDMSDTETYEQSSIELDDGSIQYVGGCSVHQDYEGKLFKIEKEIVKTYEPSYNAPTAQTMAKLKHVEIELLEATAAGSDGNVSDFFSQVDDFTLEKITSTVFKNLDLYRWNIGVGGGNGYYEIYSRSVKNGKISYDRLANVFDGDVEYCDSSVWLKK